ncbi:MAG: LacI family DNA-binding transcriptional regulator [Alphaproteobacteria bacterium]|nr:LacI family DNA-binding transcriptional regulator [Alphaproteobacteria bacterium]
MARRILRAGLPGIVDVAARAGVSPATVSRYHNSPELVRPETRTRIADAVQKLGYKPHAARSLTASRTGSVGLIVPTIDNAIFAGMVHAFSTALFRHARTMLLAEHDYDLGREAILVESLLVNGVDGLALVGLEHKDETLRQLEACERPVVYVWNYRRRQKVPCIGFDNREAGRSGMEHLLDLGHRDILALFAQTRANDRTADRRAGALNALARAGVKIPTHRRVMCPYDVQASKDVVVDILTREPRPTAIFATNDVIAQGAYFAVMSLGLRIPEEISIIGLGDFPGSSALEPGLTTLRIPARRIGQHAADALIDMLTWPSSDIDRDQKFSVELTVRGSTGVPAAKTNQGTGKKRMT